MKILKILGIVIGLLMLLYIGACAIFSKTFNVQRSIVINAPVSVVFEQINDFNKWNAWSPWMEKDPNAKVTISGTIDQPGYMFQWSSENKEVGHGSLTRTQIIPNKLLESDLKFEDMNMTSKAYFQFEEVPEGTKVIWGDKGDLPFFMRIMSPMMDGMMGKDFEKGLAKIKAVSEAHKSDAKVNADIKVEEVEVPAMMYMSMRDTASNATIGMKIGMCYGEIGKAMAKQKLKQAGAMFAIYHEYRDNYFDLEPAAPVDKAGKNDGKIMFAKMDATKAVVTHYYGPYEGVGPSYAALNGYIKTKGLKIKGSPWESYITDPMVEKDTAKWQTDIYYPVE